MYRILITGSRDWKDVEAVRAALENCIYEAFQKGVREFVIVHGKCPKGAGDIAAKEARAWKDFATFTKAKFTIEEEQHPADWKTHGGCKCKNLEGICYFAGFRRNQEMVDAKADVCYAFIRNGSNGATDCAKRAEAAGIRTIRITQDD